MYDFSCFEPRGSIAKRSAWGAGGVVIDVADEEWDVLDFLAQIVERLEALGHELRLVYEVAWRVADERHLWCDDDIGSLVQTGAIGMKDLFGIAGKISDGAIDLRDSDS